MLFMSEWLMKIGAPKLWWDIEYILHNFYNICSLWKIQLILKSRTKMPVKPVPKDSHIHILGDVILVTFFLLLCKKCTLAVKRGGWSVDSGRGRDTSCSPGVHYLSHSHPCHCFSSVDLRHCGIWPFTRIISNSYNSLTRQVLLFSFEDKGKEVKEVRCFAPGSPCSEWQTGLLDSYLHLFQNTHLKRLMHPCVHCSITYNNQGIEPSPVSANRQVHKEEVLYPNTKHKHKHIHSGIVFSHKKE